MLDRFFLNCYWKLFSQVLVNLLSYLPRGTEVSYLQPIPNHFWQGRTSIDL